MATEPKHLVLPERATGDAKETLLAFFHENRHVPVRVSARRAQRVDSRLLQCLMSAQIQWRNDGVDFMLADASAAFLAELGLLGLDVDFFEMEPPE